ncbi:hypothetical protein [Streptococcus salivarius]|uniref:hypothetical protein n=1 Tax=Streptococcus salivarius TaxID=1304 RepID=UPI00093E81C1|nr:hypothetical protein [Streptococcus salivarius]
MNRYEKLLDEKDKLEQKITINQNRLSRKLNNSTERRKRTHKLIQKGALLEKYFDIKHLSVQETEALLKIYSDYIKSNMPSKFKK